MQYANELTEGLFMAIEFLIYKQAPAVKWTLLSSLRQDRFYHPQHIDVKINK